MTWLVLGSPFRHEPPRRGLSTEDASIKAAHLRFRPILMIAFSFILGVIPLVIATGAGARSRVSLGTVVFGGMLIATVGGVFLIPWLYLVVQRTAERFGGSEQAEVPPSDVPPPIDPTAEFGA